MFEEIKQMELNKILPITLAMLPDIFQASEKYHRTYRNCSFQYLMLVVRVIHEVPDLVLTDDTRILGKEL